MVTPRVIVMRVVEDGSAKYQIQALESVERSIRRLNGDDQLESKHNISILTKLLDFQFICECSAHDFHQHIHPATFTVGHADVTLS